MEAVGIEDFIDSAIGPRAGVSEGVADGGHGQHAAAAAKQGAGGVARGAGVEHGHAFDQLGLRRLEADIDPRNAPSCRLLEGLGFVREGLLRQRWRVNGEICDSAFYGLLAEDFVRDARAQDYRFSSLIMGIATSTPFQMRKAE